MVLLWKQIFTVQFDSAWVWQRRDDEVLPAEAMKEKLDHGYPNLKVTECTYTSLSILFSENTADYSGLKRVTYEIFRELYPNDDPKRVLSLSTSESDVPDLYHDEENGGKLVWSDDKPMKEEKKDQENAKSDNDDSETTDDESETTDDDSVLEGFEERFERLLRMFDHDNSDDDEDSDEDKDEGKSEDKSEDKQLEKKSESGQDHVTKSGSGDKPENGEEKKNVALDKINTLVGAVEFKALAKEIAGIADEIKRTKTFEVFNNQCYLFSIGDGHGLTTYLNLLAELIAECGLGKFRQDPVAEDVIGSYKESSEPFSSVIKTLEYGTSRMQVLCVDISEWMDKTENRYFKQFLRTVEKHANEFIVVFRVPFVDKDVLARINYSLSDLLSVKTVSFPPFNQDEIKICAEAELKKYNFTITKSAWRYFLDRISEEKSDGKFYGVNTIKKVVRELVYQKHLINAPKQDKSSQITVNDTKALCGDVIDSNLSGMEQLKKLVGVESIEKRVTEIIAQIELAMKDTSMQKPCIHMRFVGNPGTGKTTVARIIGKILKEKGVLRVGAFFEYAGRDFCGRYIGETAPKTAGICRDAYGSVLFIDEAYSLYRGDSDSKDFGREAIDTLIAEMENHRNDFVVIMAGYNDDMDKLMGGNLGLASRMPYTIEFPNFTREQLYDIFVSMTKSKFKCDERLFDVAKTFFTELPDSVITAKDFSNARYVRNLFERTWAKSAMRCQLNGKNEVVLTAEDFELASADKEFAVKTFKKTKIGF